MLAREGARQVLPIDDEKSVRETIALFERVLGARPGEETLAREDEVMHGMRSNRERVSRWFA